jgi:hypothetical protein
MVGQVVECPIRITDEVIAPGLAKRLANYALQRMNEAGFKVMVKEWTISVYTTDATDAPSNRCYCVRFQNAGNGYIELVGILTKNGWPTLDHGYAIGHE